MQESGTEVGVRYIVITGPGVCYDVGLRTCSWPGRNQVITGPGVTYYLDGAHTVNSIQVSCYLYGRNAEYERVCVSVCLFICPLAYPKSYMSRFHQNFSPC